jgi:hypothetical protein
VYYVKYLKTGKEEIMNYENMVYRFSNDIHIELIQTGMITQIVINSKIYGKILIREMK